MITATQFKTLMDAVTAIMMQIVTDHSPFAGLLLTSAFDAFNRWENKLIDQLQQKGIIKPN
jgi:hypothetical protein